MRPEHVQETQLHLPPVRKELETAQGGDTVKPDTPAQ